MRSEQGGLHPVWPSLPGERAHNPQVRANSTHLVLPPKKAAELLRLAQTHPDLRLHGVGAEAGAAAAAAATATGGLHHVGRRCTASDRRCGAHAPHGMSPALDQAS